MPGETLVSHIEGLKKLIGFNVNIIQNHNMRLLLGAKINSAEMRQKYDFKTKYRLIHGDSSIIHTKSVSTIKAFEYEESLRSTSTMMKEEIFYLRKLHLLIDFCWNIEFYKPLLKVSKLYKIDPIDVLQKIIKESRGYLNEGNLDKNNINTFFEKFDKSSLEEWFNISS